MFISDEGLIFFGPHAVALGTNAAEAGRTRFDSPKARLSMGAQGEISKIRVGPEVNPIIGTVFAGSALNKNAAKPKE